MIIYCNCIAITTYIILLGLVFNFILIFLENLLLSYRNIGKMCKLAKVSYIT